MSVKRKPTILSSNISDNQAILVMKIDGDILDFTGHFNQFPLLPGVTQIDWAFHYARQYLNIPDTFLGMEVIKFQEPILPDSTVELTLTWDEARSKLAFKYTGLELNEQQPVSTHSSGKMKIGVSSAAI